MPTPTLTCAWEGAAAAKTQTANKAKYLKYLMVLSSLDPNFLSQTPRTQVLSGVSLLLKHLHSLTPKRNKSCMNSAPLLSHLLRQRPVLLLGALQRPAFFSQRPLFEPNQGDISPT